MEHSLILLKPDAIQKRICGTIIERFEQEGFTIRGCKMIHLNPELLKDHYAHIADKDFYPEVEKFMRSTPVIAIVFEGDGVVEKVREMLGETDSRKAAPGTIRAEFGEDQMLNVVHASDSPEAGEREVQRFFSKEEIFEY